MLIMLIIYIVTHEHDEADGLTAWYSAQIYPGAWTRLSLFEYRTFKHVGLIGTEEHILSRHDKNIFVGNTCKDRE